MLPKGVREYDFSESRLREWIRETIKRTYERYGFLPLEEPCLQKLSVLLAKSGEGIAGEIFRIENSDIGLRFDLTVPFAHFAANSPLPKPLKRYWIGKAWRREEPQHMRLREFWQADADIVGSSSPYCEVELLLAATEALKRLGLKPKIVINSRKLVEPWLKKAGVKEEEKDEVLRTIDKLDKLGKKGVEELLEKKGLAHLCEDLEKTLDEAKKLEPEEGARLEIIIGKLQEYGREVEFSFSLVRGLGYYTGTVFEIKEKNHGGASIGGGGRYDNLLEHYGFGAEAVGIGLGIDRIFALLENKEIQNKCIYLLSLDSACDDSALALAQELRQNGLCVSFLPAGKKLAKFFQYVESQNGQVAIAYGKKEKASAQVQVRWMKEKAVEAVPIKDLPERIKTYFKE